MTATLLQLKQANSRHSDQIAIITLNRPDSANAFNLEMIKEITDHLDNVINNHARVLIFRNTGMHFCAGADLEWMKSSAKLSYEQNLAETELMRNMFDQLYQLPIPTIAVTKGAVYGGGVGLVACCDIILAHTATKFCLSEVKLGLLPAVIVPYLAKRLSPSALKYYALTAKAISADEAYQMKFVNCIFNDTSLEKSLNEKINLLLQGAPQAQRRLKKLMQSLDAINFQSTEETSKAIAEARQSQEAKQGLKAFFEKNTPPYCITLDDQWSLE